jgi:hypothetical protein
MNRPTVKLMDSHCKHYYYSIVSDHSTQSLSAVITDFGDLKPVQAEQYARKSLSDWDSGMYVLRLLVPECLVQ